jgi:uncharacterized protein with von Willebrand factor type A (vWA) domain
MMIHRETSLSKNIVKFCRFLRERHFSIGVEEERVALQALAFTNLEQPNAFRLALKTTLCRNKTQYDVFDTFFLDYWRELDKAADSKITQQQNNRFKSKQQEDASFKALKSWLNGNKNEEIEEAASYSLQENLGQKDFSTVPADEIDELLQSIKALARRMAAQLHRRHQYSHKINKLDLRRTLRKNRQFGGEILELAFQKPRKNRTQLVVLCDVSKSMELYTAFLLQFMYGFQQAFKRIETFAFGTELQRVTGLLKANSFEKILAQLSQQQRGWSGGTKIGASLATFVEEHGKSILTSKTIVIILSDGWDTGDLEQLEASMKTIKEKSKKVIWLNPLAGYENYRPETAGMKTVLPYTDIFASVHNAESLRKLARMIS